MINAGPFNGGISANLGAARHHSSAGHITANEPGVYTSELDLRWGHDTAITVSTYGAGAVDCRQHGCTIAVALALSSGAY